MQGPETDVVSGQQVQLVDEMANRSAESAASPNHERVPWPDLIEKFVELGRTISYIEDDLDWWLEQTELRTGQAKPMGSTSVGSLRLIDYSLLTL